jgi:hypothetical protein
MIDKNKEIKYILKFETRPRPRIMSLSVNIERENYLKPRFFRTYARKEAKKRGLEIPPHPAIDSIDILLRLKPPHWRLNRFHIYLNWLAPCCWRDNRYDNYHPFESILFQHELFFFLDNNLNREDVMYMLYLLKIPLINDLPAQFTGESIVRGELANYVYEEDYTTVLRFTDSIREKFAKQVDNVARVASRNQYFYLMISKFNLTLEKDDEHLRGYFTSMMVAYCVYPIITLPSTPPENVSSKVINVVKASEVALNTL